MAMLVQTLSPAQMAKLPQYADEWTRIGLCTDAADRPRAERAIVAMYEGAKLKAPRIVWCDSPIQCDDEHELIGARTGRLLRREIRDDEPIVIVDLLNSTPEPDGSVKRYQFRVPPNTKTVLEGLAWGYGFEMPKLYRPSVET